MSIRHEAVRLLEGDEPRTESNVDRIVNGLLAENYTLACEKYAAEYAARPRGDTMSERQVQYTDGSWSREVEVGDDLLDEATRLAAEFNRQFPITANTLRALVERVQQAEQEAETQAGIAAIHKAERDEARGKLDAVRDEVATVRAALGYRVTLRRMHPHETVEDSLREQDAEDVKRLSDVLAILDGKTGD